MFFSMTLECHMCALQLANTNKIVKGHKIISEKNAIQSFQLILEKTIMKALILQSMGNRVCKN